MKTNTLFFAIAALVIVSCSKDDVVENGTPANTGPRLILKFKFDSTQVRLNGFGQPEPAIEAGHGAQSPVFNKMSAHYAEFAQTATTLLGQGDVVYHASEWSNPLNIGQRSMAKPKVGIGGDRFASAGDDRR